MRAKPTSAEAFKQIQEEGLDVSLQERIVYDLYHRGPSTRRALARRMHMEDRWSSVTARIRELLDLDVLEEVGTEKDPETGRVGNVVNTTEHAIPWLKGEYDPEPREREKPRAHSAELMEAVKQCVDNPGSITAWNQLREAYEEGKP